MARGLSILSRFAFLINCFCAVGMMLAHWAPNINPSKFYLGALVGLSFPLWTLLNFLFLIYWIYRFKRQLVLPLVVIMLSWSSVSNMYQGFADREEVKNGIRLMSYNVRLFNLYRWLEEEDIPLKQLQLIKSANPDIIAFQEYYQKNRVTEKLPHPYKRIALINPEKNYGLALYSRYPILNSQLIDMGVNTANAAMFADLLIGKDTVRVFNVHLASLKLGATDYAFLDNIKHEQSEEVLKTGTKKILQNMRIAYNERAQQTDVLRKKLSESPYPVILMGDFNDVPQSYTYAALSEDLKDAFVESGIGFGRTYTRYLPSFRIDYLLHDNKWRAYNFEVLNDEVLSDHYPVVCDLMAD